MQKTIFLLLLFSLVSLYSQEFSLSKIVVDSISKEPLSYVDVYNSKHYVTTNEEGRFEILSKIDSLSFNLLGYQPKRIKISSFTKQTDTIFLSRKEAALREVYIKDYKELIKSTFKNYRKDLLSKPFAHRFYIRAVERRDNKIVTLIDITAKALYKVKQGQQKYKAYDLIDVEVEQLRSYGVKTHMFHKQSMPKVFQCFWTPFSINFHGEDKKIEDVGFVYDDVKEIKFETLDTVKGKMHFKGFFKIDAVKEKLLEYQKFSTERTYDEIPFKKFFRYKFRPVVSKRHNIYNLDQNLDKVYPKYGSLTYGFEARRGKKPLETFDFDVKVILLEPFLKEPVHPNVKSTEYIVDIEAPYNAAFWNHQQTLKLTKEQQEFINRIRKKEDFGFGRNKIISNE